MEQGGSFSTSTMNDIYRTIIEGLDAKSVLSYFQRENQLVISRRSVPALPFGGNSFFITNQERQWYLFTWSPAVYKVPPEADLVGLCELFVDFGDEAQAEVPVEIAQHFGITRLSDEEAAETFGW
jgi:hypothetical protein